MPKSICFGGRSWIYYKSYRENILGKKLSVKMLDFGDTGFLGLISLGFLRVVGRCRSRKTPGREPGDRGLFLSFV